MYSYLHYSNFYHYNKCLRRLVKSKEHLMIDHLLAKKKMYNDTCLAKYLKAIGCSSLRGEGVNYAQIKP